RSGEGAAGLSALGRVHGQRGRVRRGALRHPAEGRGEHRSAGAAVPRDVLEPAGGDRVSRRAVPRAEDRCVRGADVRHVRGAGGVNLILHPSHFIALGARNMLASDGAVKVFDARADGYVPGEGVGAVLLKALPDALADGDDVWAVIKGGAMNAGGKTSGYTVP